MQIKLGQLLKELLPSEFEEMRLNHNRTYRAVHLLWQKTDELDDACIYVGNASCLPRQPHALRGCLIVQNDIGMSFSDLTCDYALLKKSGDLSWVYERLKNAWDVLENRETLNFFNALTRCTSLNALVEYASASMGCPILMADHTGHLLAHAQSENIEDPSFSSIISSGTFTMLQVQAAEREGVVRRVNETEVPIKIGPGEYRTRNRILGNIIIRGTYSGILLALEGKTPLTAYDTKCVTMICYAIANLVERSEDANLAGIFYQQCFETFLEDDTEDSGWFQFWLRRQGWESFPRFQVFAMEREPLERRRRVMQKQLRMIAAACQAQFLEAKGSWLLFVNTGIPKLADRFRQDFSAFLSKFDCHAGGSDAFGRIEGLPNGFVQAQKALALGRQLKRPEDIYLYRDLKVHCMLAEIPMETLRSSYCSAALAELRCYDRQKGTQYCETLQCFLEHACSRAETARALYVHRNTVAYQLRRMEELLDVDLSNGETCLQLFLSFKIEELGDMGQGG